MNPTESSSFDAVAKLLGTWHRVMLVSHAKPDGDALGSLVAMHRLLTTRGADSTIVTFDAIPDRYALLQSLAPLPMLGRDVLIAGCDSTKGVNPTGSQSEHGSRSPSTIDPATLDGLIILDTCAYTQLEPIAEWLRRTPVPKLVIDHHLTRDELADQYLIDESAAAASLIIHDFAKAMRWPLDAETATALFVGIATDTGWFHHSNTDARVFAACSELVERGANPNALYERMFQQETLGRFRLRTAVTKRLELECGGRLAVMTLPKTIFAECGATLDDTEDLVNEPLRIGPVLVSLMFVEQENGVIRIGLRSREPLDGQTPDIDVAAIAKNLGGGGHRRAAGARFTGSMADARTRVTQLVMDSLSGRQP